MRTFLIFLLVLIAFVQPASAEAVGETFLDTITNTIQVFTGFVTNVLNVIKNGFMNVVNAIKALIPSRISRIMFWDIFQIGRNHGMH